MPGGALMGMAAAVGHQRAQQQDVAPAGMEGLGGANSTFSRLPA